jgi:hypothetical protein
MDWGTISTAVGGSIGAALTVMRVAPRFLPKINENGDGLDRKIERAISLTLNAKLLPLLERQTDILDRMENSQERMHQILGDNTMALQVFLKAEEIRESRGRRGGS